MPFGPILVHVFTALGVVCALLATGAATGGRYEEMFGWLGLALIIDGVDGPLARWVNVKERLARFSGERLDLVIDYLTYVFVPVLAALNAGLFPPSISVALAAAILLSSLYHFADTHSKAQDNSFIGFPAIWNVVVFYILIFQPTPWVAAGICAACVGLTFVPLKWLHPVRVAAWRPVTMLMLLLWALAAAVALWTGFSVVPAWAKALLAATALYALAVPVFAAQRARADD